MDQRSNKNEDCEHIHERIIQYAARVTHFLTCSYTAMLCFIFAILFVSTRAQTVCGAADTRCNGSFGTYVFYTCCNTGLVCAPFDANGGACRYGVNYTTPPTQSGPLIITAGAGVQGTRCNGSYCGIPFYTQCQPYLLCVPFDAYGGSCEYGPIPLSNWTLPACTTLSLSGPTTAPTNDCTRSLRPSTLTLVSLAVISLYFVH